MQKIWTEKISSYSVLLRTTFCQDLFLSLAISSLEATQFRMHYMLLAMTYVLSMTLEEVDRLLFKLIGARLMKNNSDKSLDWS